VAPFRLVPMEQRDHVEISKYDPNHGEQEVQVLSGRRILLVIMKDYRAFVRTLELMGILIGSVFSFNQCCCLQLYLMRFASSSTILLRHAFLSN
jgi:hypothetical protein